MPLVIHQSSNWPGSQDGPEFTLSWTVHEDDVYTGNDARVPGNAYLHGSCVQGPHSSTS